MKIKLANILQPSKVAGITVYFRNQTEYDLSVCILEQKRGTLHINKKQTDIQDISNLKEIIPQSLPVIVSFLGNVVLNKEYGIIGDDSGENQHLPGNQENDFYSYEYKSENAVGMSLCRRTVIDDILKIFGENKFIIVGTAIGPYSVSALWEYGIINPEHYIPVVGGKLNYNSQTSIFHFSSHGKEKKTEFLQIGDEELESRLTVSYTNAMLWLLNSNNVGYIGEYPAEIFEGYKYKFIIDKTKYWVLALVFLVLMINFLVYESFRKREVAISSEMALNTGIISKRDSLDKELKAKDEFIKYIGENKTYYSFYLDAIAATVPENIVLERIDVNPLISKIQKNEQVIAEKKVIIDGLSSNSLTLNQWSRQLSELEWVKSTNVISFERTNDNQMGQFTLEIEMNL